MDYVDLLKSSFDKESVIRAFYADVESELRQHHSNSELEEASVKMLELLKDTDVDDLVDILDDDVDLRNIITAKNIAQFSNIDDIDMILSIVDANSGSDDLDYRLMGYYFNKEAKAGAQTKYGENHYKTAMLMGLTTEKKRFEVTGLGYAYLKLSKADKSDIRTKLFLKIPVVRVVMVESLRSAVDVSGLMRGILSETTVRRRLSNIKKLLLMLIEKSDRKEIYKSNIIWK